MAGAQKRPLCVAALRWAPDMGLGSDTADPCSRGLVGADPIAGARPESGCCNQDRKCPLCLAAPGGRRPWANSPRPTPGGHRPMAGELTQSVPRTRPPQGGHQPHGRRPGPETGAPRCRPPGGRRPMAGTWKRPLCAAAQGERCPWGWRLGLEVSAPCGNP